MTINSSYSFKENKWHCNWAESISQYDSYIMGGHNENSEIAVLHGIPFSINKKDGTVCVLEYKPFHRTDQSSMDINEYCEALFFLGMTTDKPECSEWWGQNERHHYHGKRLFIGDLLGKISIDYSDNTMDYVPVIFGVTAWPYELYVQVKDNEKDLTTYGGPYMEPFASDPKAARLLRESLLLMENNTQKATKYILGIKVRNKKIDKVRVSKEDSKEAGFIVSAVTGLKRGNDLDPLWTVVNPGYFIRQEYFKAMDKLSRRLYQYRDELPSSVSIDRCMRYNAPNVAFGGNGFADMFTNVYNFNWKDMAEEKVDINGKARTSSFKAPSYGSYIGFGTYKKCDTGGVYATQMWSRDIGRLLVELVCSGEYDRTLKAGNIIGKYLYTSGCNKLLPPHWKRICNTSELGDDILERFVAGKENDGHALLMLFIYNLYSHNVVGTNWLKDNKKDIFNAAGWFAWQIDNPDQSNFDGVLYSESEASTQKKGGFDLFSNAVSFYALKGYEVLAEVIGEDELKKLCSRCSSILMGGIMEKFTTVHPRYGRIFTDTIDDGWTYEYKRFALLFKMPDIYTYDPAEYDDELYSIFRNTYSAQKEDYFSYTSGRQMGYGQGFLTQTAILLDEYEDMAGCLAAAAGFCYHHSDNNYIVPEGVIMHPSGRFWFRNADLGNAVQQAEIVKCARLLLGLDDNLRKEGLNLVPRLPSGWNSIEVSNYGISAMTQEGRKSVKVSLKYKKSTEGYRLCFIPQEPVRVRKVRIGPFSGDAVNFDINEGCDFVKKIISGNTFLYIDVSRIVNKLDIEVKEGVLANTGKCSEVL